MAAVAEAADIVFIMVPDTPDVEAIRADVDEMERMVESYLAFARDLAAAGGLGMITPDLIPDEAERWLGASDAHDLDRIFLVAPSSTPERLARTVEASRGFVYAASTMGVTGARDVVSHAAPELVGRVKEISDIPVGVGLGVRSREQAAEIAHFADGVIVGSALVSALTDGVGAVRSLTEELAVGVRQKVPAT